MRAIAVAATIGWCATAAWAETAGPPQPPAPKRTPAEITAALYKDRYGLELRVASCAPARAGEVVVCGSRSPYRVPLPDERGPPDHARRPTGEIPRAGGGAEPVRRTDYAGLAARLRQPTPPAPEQDRPD